MQLISSSFSPRGPSTQGQPAGFHLGESTPSPAQRVLARSHTYTHHTYIREGHREPTESAVVARSPPAAAAPARYEGAYAPATHIGRSPPSHAVTSANVHQFVRRSVKGERDSRPHHISIPPKDAIAIVPPKKVSRHLLPPCSRP